MTISELLSHVRSLKIKVRVDGGYLVCDGPKEALTLQLRAELLERKAEILDFLNGAQGATPRKEPVLRRIPREGRMPLSFSQRRLWFLDQFEPGSPLYNVPRAIRIQGSLNAAWLEKSLNEIVRRHEVLRTTFSATEGRPVQVIAGSLILTVPVIDLTDRSENERQTEALRLANEDARRPFDLARGPLLRATVLCLGLHDHVLLLNMHHIISDGWSMGLLYRELSVLYQAFSEGHSSPLTELPIQYADFAQWQSDWLQGEALERQISYWKKQLRSLPTLQLPSDRPRPAAQSHRGARVSILLPGRLREALEALSKRQQASLFMTLLAAFKVLLYRYSGQEDIAVGIPIAGRNRIEIEGLIGFFVNTLVLRTDLSGDCTFRELLGRVRETALEAYAHQELPFEKMVEELDPDRNLSHTPLVQVMFSFQNFPSSPLQFPGSTVRQLELETETAKFDLTFQIDCEDTDLSCRCVYNTDLFSESTIGRMLGHFQSLLEGVVRDSGQKISLLPLMTQAEKRLMVVEWNDTKRDSPTDQCIHRSFEAQARRTPDRTAVVFEDREITYKELNTRANQLARYLRARGVGPEVLVGLCVERSLEMIIGLLAALKAGGAYVPLDPGNPKNRLQFMIQDARPAVFLTQRGLVDDPLVDEAGTIYLDADWQNISRQEGTDLDTGPDVDSLAYVIYTSGSTGEPKGVAVEHRQLLNYSAHMIRELEPGAGCSFAMVQPLMFDSSATAIFASLLTGGSLHVISRERASDPGMLRDYVDRRPIDFLKITPSHLAALQASSSPEHLMPRRALVIGGEESRWDWIQSLRSLAPDCKIFNHYGPTETTVGVLIYRTQNEDNVRTVSRTPLGRPIANTRVYLLDRQLQPVPIGVPGELHIGGLSVARGYLNRPDLTAEKFIPDAFSSIPGTRLYKSGDLARYLPDGNIEFLGRIDNQVKIRGFRIEPEEIEIALRRHPDIRDAAVAARGNGEGGKQLTAYVVSDPRRAPAAAGKSRYRLPNGIAVAQLNKNETDYMYEEIFERQAYLRHGITIRDGDCIFDVGANIGLFMAFSDRIAEGLTIYSFEPNPVVFDLLRDNAARCAADVRLFQCGLSDGNRTAAFSFFPGFSLLSGFYADTQTEKAVIKAYMLNQRRAGQPGIDELFEQADDILDQRLSPRTFTAQLRTLSSVIDREKVRSIDLLKINAEKSEWDVLKGIEESHWTVIKQIVLEVDVEENLQPILSLLGKHGFETVAEQDVLLENTPLRYVYAIRPCQDRRLVSEQGDRTHPRPVPDLDNALLSADELRSFLRQQLPEYMLPSSFVFLDALPLTPNGKIDRQALPAPEDAGPDLREDFAPARNPTEEVLAEIWSRLLGVERIGIHDNFFDLGGHSLLATQVMSRVREAFRVEIPLRALFENPTVAGLAAHLAQNTDSDPEEIADFLSDVESLSDEEARKRLAGRRSQGRNNE